MKVAGSSGRMELHPESAEEKEFLQGMLDTGKEAALYWGDADEGGTAFVINNTRVGAADGQTGAPATEPPQSPSISAGA